MEAITYRFLDWAKQRIVEQSEGVLAVDSVFDEREQDLGNSIKLSVMKGLGVAVVLSLPDLNMVGNEPGETLYSVSADVWVFHNKGLSPDFDSVKLTEHLFRQFAGVKFDLPNGHLRPNIKADNLRHEVNGTKQTHYFTLSYNELL